MDTDGDVKMSDARTDEEKKKKKKGRKPMVWSLAKDKKWPAVGDTIFLDDQAWGVVVRAGTRALDSELDVTKSMTTSKQIVASARMNTETGVTDAVFELEKQGRPEEYQPKAVFDSNRQLLRELTAGEVRQILGVSNPRRWSEYDACNNRTKDNRPLHVNDLAYFQHRSRPSPSSVPKKKKQRVSPPTSSSSSSSVVYASLPASSSSSTTTMDQKERAEWIDMLKKEIAWKKALLDFLLNEK
jgi:hypothetical protein